MNINRLQTLSSDNKTERIYVNQFEFLSVLRATILGTSSIYHIWDAQQERFVYRRAAEGRQGCFIVDGKDDLLCQRWEYKPPGSNRIYILHSVSFDDFWPSELWYDVWRRCWSPFERGNGMNSRISTGSKRRKVCARRTYHSCFRSFYVNNFGVLTRRCISMFDQCCLSRSTSLRNLHAICYIRGYISCLIIVLRTRKWFIFWPWYIFSDQC